ANRAQDIFVRDLLANKTALASFNAAGTASANGDSFSPTISSNGQFVLFHSKAGNLTSGILAGIENLYWRDLQQGQTHALTTNGVSAASMTPDGSVVAYITSSSRAFSPPSDRLYLWDSRSKAIVYSM